MGFEQGSQAFKPEDLFHQNDEDDKIYLSEYQIVLDTGNPIQ